MTELPRLPDKGRPVLRSRQSKRHLSLDLTDSAVRKAIVRVITRPFLVALAFGVAALFFWPFCLAALVSLADVRARLRDYARFRRRRFHPLCATELGRSWCGRGVAEAIWPEAKAFFHARGYRSWHIFPDGAPLVFFDIRFIRSVLGIDR